MASIARPRRAHPVSRLRPRLRALAAPALVALAALAAPARADAVGDDGGREPDHRDGAAASHGAAREARARTDRARALYERGDYGGASANYREAYRLRPSPGVLFNLAQAYRQDGRCAEAAGAYRAALATELDGPARELASRQLEATELCVRALDLSAARSNRTMRRNGLITIGAGGAALVIASGLALADRDRRDDETRPLTIGLAIGGGAAVTTGAVFYAVAERRMRAHRRARPDIFRVPIGSTRVAGVTWNF